MLQKGHCKRLRKSLQLCLKNFKKSRGPCCESRVGQRQIDQIRYLIPGRSLLIPGRSLSWRLSQRLSHRLSHRLSQRLLNAGDANVGAALRKSHV